MRILVVGSRSFGAAALEALATIEGAGVVSSVGPPIDLDVGTHTDALRRAAWAHGINCWAPNAFGPRIVDDERVDLIVCAHHHGIVPADAIAACRLGAIGYHPSLLPRHRGRDAVEWTIRMRDPIAGGSVYWLTGGMDAGPIAAQEHVHVRPDDTASTLWGRALFPLGLRLLERVVRDLVAGHVVARPQDPACVTHEPPIRLEHRDDRCDEFEPAHRVRAVRPLARGGRVSPGFKLYYR